MGQSRRCQNWSERKKFRLWRIRTLKTEFMKNDVGNGGGFWLFSKWNIEIKEELHTWKQSDPWHWVARQDQGWSDTMNYSLSSVWPSYPCCVMMAPDVLVSDSWNKWHSEYLAFQLSSLWAIFFWWGLAGPTLSLDWNYPLGPSVTSTLKIQTLLPTPVGSFVWTSNAHAGLLQQCHGSQRPATSHSLRGWTINSCHFFNEPFQGEIVLVCPTCQVGFYGGRASPTIAALRPLFWSTFWVICTSLAGMTLLMYVPHISKC